MRRAIATLTIGEAYRWMAERAHPLMERYARRLGAAFVVIDTPRLNHRSDGQVWTGWEKYQLADVLGEFERLVFFDTDVFVRPDCPDLMEFCGERFGAFNEAHYTPAVMERLDSFCRFAGLPVAPRRLAYYNGGVMVCSRRHRQVFAPPPVLYSQDEFRFAEQTHTTARLHQLGVECRDLPQCFNAMPGWMAIPGYEETCPVVHLAAFERAERNRRVEELLQCWWRAGFGV